MSNYRPRVQTIKKQQTIVMNEESFPSLSNQPKLLNQPNQLNQTNFYKDKLKFSMNENKNDEKKDELPKGWIVLDRNYNPKKKVNTLPKKEEEQKEPKEEKIHFDFSPLIQLWKKRRENYIELYGEDNYIKTFGYGSYYNFFHLEEDKNLSDSHDEFLEEEDDMSSIE